MGRINHPIAIFPAISHCTSFPPLRIPIPMTAPTTACELETGTKGIAGRLMECKQLLIPCEANRNNTIEWAITTMKAAGGESLSKSLPMVNITFFE